MRTLLIDKRAMESSSDNEVSIGHDMLVEVLTKLPLKSFSQSACVSRSWCGLTRDDYVRAKLPVVVSGVFRNSESSLGSDNPTYISNVDTAAGLQPVNLDFLPFRSHSSLIDCCNGLLLFYSSLTASFHVCNPITRRHVALPKPPSRTLLSIAAFDPYHSRRYKVVNFVRWLGQGAELEVFDSGLGKWAAREVRWGVDTDALSATMRYVDGTLYILARPDRMVAIELEPTTLTCSVFKLPETTEIGSCIGKLGGGLHYGVSNGNQIRVWMLKGKEWVLRYCVRVTMCKFRLLGFNPEKDVVYMWAGMRLVAYDLGEERVEEIWDLGHEKGHLMHVWVFPFAKNMEDVL